MSIGILFAISRGLFHLYAVYEYENEVSCNWDLSVRASTIAQKSEYIDKFVQNLESAKLEGIHNAIMLKTDENYFNENLKSLKSLQNRLKTILCMDENSFAYQTALQQINEQEQGETEKLLSNLHGCWLKKVHYTLWNDIICFSFLILQFAIIIIGFMISMDEF